MSVFKKFFAYSLMAIAIFSIIGSFGNVTTVAQITTPNTCPNGQCPLIGTTNLTNVTQNTVASFILGIARIFTYFIAAISVLFMVYAGFLFVTDGGDGTRAGNGKKILFNAIIGLVVSIVAYTIVQVVSNVAAGNLAGNLIQNS